MEVVTLKLQVYQAIRARILSGEYALGEKLNIDALCREFSVSNSPVREALSMLVANHLVVTKANTGAYVIDLTPDDYNELADAYNLFLLGAYEICCRNNKKALLLQHLEQRMRDFVRSVHFGNDQERIKAVLYLDRSFITATENQKSISMFDSDLDLLFLAYIYNHQNHAIDWQHNIQRSKMLIQAVRDEQGILVQEILCERTNPHIKA